MTMNVECKDISFHPTFTIKKNLTIDLAFN